VTIYFTLAEFILFYPTLRSRSCRDTKMTAQTMRASGTHQLPLFFLGEYALAKLQVKYISLAKIQTDNLEQRIGEYR